VIWAIDAVWMIFAMAVSAAGTLACCGKLACCGTAVRKGVSRWWRSGIVVATAAFIALSDLFIPLPLERDPWVLIGGGVAVIAACFGSATYVTSLVTLLGIATALAGLGHCPVGVPGLLHHIALVDLAGVCLAITFLAAWDLPTSESLSPVRLARRCGCMFGILCAVLAWAMYRDERIFEMPAWLGWWAAISEIMAAAVSWRVVQEWLSPQKATKRLDWKYRTGLLIAGTVSLLSLVLVPIILSTAENLR
jgi:hypothetical protein